MGITRTHGSAFHTAASQAERSRTNSPLMCLAAMAVLLAFTTAWPLGVGAIPHSAEHVVMTSTPHLFRGDLVRLWPHLGWIAAGSIDVEHADRPVLVRVNCQLWENGVKKADLPGPGGVMKRIGPQRNHDSPSKWEASISLKPVAASDDGNPRMEVRMVLQNGYTVATHEPVVIAVPRARGASGMSLITEPISARPSNSYAVWQHVMMPNPSSVLPSDPGEKLADCAWGVVMGIEVSAHHSHP